MKIIEPGHIYQLQHLDGSGAGMRVFVNREAGTEHEGTQTQEILRALIDRTQHCDNCLRWDGNDKIIHHLRMALSLHEARALERKTEKGELQPENVKVGSDGHFITVSSERVAMFGIGRIVACQHVLWHEADRCRHNLPMGTTCEKCLRECATCWDDCATASTYCPRPAAEFTMHVGVDPAAPYSEPKTTDYCVRCGESPDSGSHLPTGHDYIDPRYNAIVPRAASIPFEHTTLGRTTTPYRCNVPMCGESGVCDACRKRDAR